MRHRIQDKRGESLLAPRRWRGWVADTGCTTQIARVAGVSFERSKARLMAGFFFWCAQHRRAVRFLTLRLCIFASTLPPMRVASLPCIRGRSADIPDFHDFRRQDIRSRRCQRTVGGNKDFTFERQLSKNRLSTNDPERPFGFLVSGRSDIHVA